MARHATSPVHHIGTFLLLAATILLLITTISAPVIKDIAILKVYLTNATTIRNSSVTFGTFGHCVLDVPPVQ
jgi:predicted membrane channel-forming protein YqfA (hemolysin III family)